MSANAITFCSLVNREVFKSGDLSDLERADLESYFKAIKQRFDSGEQFPYDLMELVPTVFSHKHKAVEALERDFNQGIDFISSTARLIDDNPKPQVDYHLAPLAFEFMVARKSKPIFEIYHRVFHAATNPVDLTREQILVMALESERERMRLTSELEAAQPMIQFHEEVTAREGEFTIPQTCKTLFDGAVPDTQLRAWLKHQHWMDNRKGMNEPTMWAIRQGLMRLKLNIKIKPGIVVNVPVITAKGLALLRHLYRTGELFIATIPIERRMPAPELSV